MKNPHILVSILLSVQHSRGQMEQPCLQVDSQTLMKGPEKISEKDLSVPERGWDVHPLWVMLCRSLIAESDISVVGFGSRGSLLGTLCERCTIY